MLQRMKSISLKAYYDHISDDGNHFLGLINLTSEVVFGRYQNEVWEPLTKPEGCEVITQMYPENTDKNQKKADIHILYNDLPDGVYIAVQQEVTDDRYAITPIIVPRNGSLIMKTVYFFKK